MDHTHTLQCLDLNPRNECPIYAALLAAQEVMADAAEWGNTLQACRGFDDGCFGYCRESAIGGLRHRLHVIGMAEDDAPGCGTSDSDRCQGCDSIPCECDGGVNEYPEGSGR